MESNWPGVLFTSEFQTKIRNSPVLLVGAGGIGSEVLKTLVLAGFRKITLIDMDTIEISNLNRQFLFRSIHVGQSKAKVAAEAVEQFLPVGTSESLSLPMTKKQKLQDGQSSSQQTICPLQIRPYHANIKDSTFNIDFFKGFEIVLNGLDNLDARRHVNRLCLAAEVPLIESGTAGYDGNVTVHIKGRSHCYECEEKPIPRSFPICTIRNTPEKLIHCVVWSKDLLFTRCFGAIDQTSDLDEDYDEVNGSFFLKKSEESVLDYAIRVFHRVFDQDIQNVLKIDELWTRRQPPNPIKWSFDYTYPDPLTLSTFDAHKVLTLTENVELFLSSICSIFDSRSSEIGSLHFDKDDELTLAFVTSASNLRAFCYGIPPTSIFEIKGMAGNIIHAIATTNAIVGGMIVNECCKVLSGCHRFLKESFVGRHSTWGLQSRKRDMLIKSTMPLNQNPNCVVCGKSMLCLAINTKTTTLSSFLTKIIKGVLGVSEPNLSCEGFFYEEGEGLDEDEEEEYKGMLDTVLTALPGGGIQDGSTIALHSQNQHLRCKIIVRQQDTFDDEETPEGFVLRGSLQDPDEEGPILEVTKRERSHDQTTESIEVCAFSDVEIEEEEEEEEITIFSPKKQRLN